MPAYRNTDSPPYQQNHMAFPRYYQPVMEGIPPQMNVDPSKSPSAYEQTRPYIGGPGYPSPMQFCCGGHHRFPGYWTYAPAYPYIPASSPMCFSGGYPACPEPFYAPYAPPSHYTMELPRHEYDKCMPGEYHCCGCPNHPLSHKEGKGVKIEEHEPDAEKKVNNAVCPSQWGNYSYPFVWMPPQYMDNKVLKKPDATEVGDQHDRKSSEYARADGEEPKLWNIWVPLDINNLANRIQDANGRKNKIGQIDNSMREAEGGKTNPSQQSERNRREIPFPVIWLPNYDMQEGARTRCQESTSPVEDVPRVLNAAPVFSRPSGDALDRSNVNGNDLKAGDSDVTRKEINENNIPIKQMELQKSEPECHQKRVRDIPVKQVQEDTTGKETQTSMERQSSSPKKTSKLPPVCLRVDPLPRKKNGNGSSRSPSPSKKGSVASTNGTSKSSTSSSMHDEALADVARQQASDVRAELKPKEKTAVVGDVKLQKDSDITEDVKPHNKSVKVLEKSSEKKFEDRMDGTQSQVTSNANTEVHKNSSALTSMGESWTNAKKINGNETERKANDMIKEEPIEAVDAKERKLLSDTEAAVLIQAAYRGFEVRKWEPLKKLKQIAEVSKHVTDIRGSIQALEASSNKQIYEREKVTIGETIMRLLLKLDTIQGLHPNFREMRKSLARELTSLQEKLDSVVAKKSQLHVEDLSIRRFMTPPVGSNGECMQEQPEEEGSMPGKDSSKGIIQVGHDSSEQQAEGMMEQGRDQLSLKNGNPSYDDEKLKSVVNSFPVDDAKCRFSSPIGKEFNEKPEPLPIGEAVNEAFHKLSEDEASGCDISKVQPKTGSELEGIPRVADKLDMKAWEESPRGVINDLEADNFDFRKDKADETEREKLQISAVTNTSGDDIAEGRESFGMHELEELPIGLLDDDTTDSEKHKESGSSQVLVSEERECDDAQDGESSRMHELEELPIALLDGDTEHKESQISAQVLRSEEKECDDAHDGESSRMHELEELPIGLLDGDTAESEKRKESQISAQVLRSEERECDDAQDGESSRMHEMEELPIGLLDDDTTDFEKHKETGISAQVLRSEEEECNPAPITLSLADDTSKETQLDQLQQQLGEQEENQSNEGSDDWVKVGYEQDELRGDVSENAKVESGSREENDEQSVTTAFTGNDGHGVAKEDACLEVNEVTVMEAPEQEIKVDAEKKVVLPEQMGEQGATSPLLKEVPLPKQDGEMDTDKNLIEENEKLRKMMQKLLEAGNEQLAVISNLTERVKDLEKKLANKKRVKTMHCRQTTSKPSFKKSSNNNQLQQRISGVAM